MKRFRFFGKGVLVLASIAVLSGLVMGLWNAVVPDLFVGTPRIDYLHALGLLVLCRILFGGFGGHRARHPHRHGWGHRGRWDATAEEREMLARDEGRNT